MKQESLNRIIDHCLNNDRRGQQQLYEYTYTSLAAVVSLYTKDNSERDWVFNTGMLKVFKKLSGYKKGTNFLGWARTILVYSAIDHYRRASSKLESTGDMDIVQNTRDFSELNKALGTLELEYITEKIQSLELREKTVFNLHVIEGYSHKEIQKLTGIKENTSKWLLNKAKLKLQELLKEANLKNTIQ